MISHKVFARQPLVLQYFLSSGPFGRVKSEAGGDELLGSLGDVLPILNGLELVITSNDSLSLLGLRVSIERRVAAKEEIGNDAHSPDVDGFVMSGCIYPISWLSNTRVKRGDIFVTHTSKISRAPCTTVGSSQRELSQVLPVLMIKTHTGGTADFGKEGHLFRLDDPAEAEVADHNVSILAGVPEQQIFWLKIAVDDSTFVKVCNCAEDGPDEICSIPVIEEGEVMDLSKNM